MYRGARRLEVEVERREGLARSHGYASWSEAIELTAGLTAADAAARIGSSATTVFAWRRSVLPAPAVEVSPTVSSRFSSTYEAVSATATFTLPDAARATGLTERSIRSRRVALGFPEVHPEARSRSRAESAERVRAGELREERARSLGYESFDQALEAMSGLPSRRVASELGVSKTLVTKRRGARTSRPRERLDASARALGYLSFPDLLRETRTLSPEEVADLLETTVERVVRARPSALGMERVMERSVAARVALLELRALGWTNRAVGERTGFREENLSRIASSRPPDSVSVGTTEALRGLLMVPLPATRRHVSAHLSRTSVEEVASAVKDMRLTLSQREVALRAGLKQGLVSTIERRVAQTVTVDERDRIVAAHEEYVRARR